MPRINEQENLHDRLVENKESKCNFSNRCKLVLCISASLIVMVGFGIADIYYAVSYDDGSDITI